MTKFFFTLSSFGLVAAMVAAAAISSLPEALRALLTPAAAATMSGVLLAYGSLDPRPSPRWYDKLTFSTLCISGVLLFLVLAGGADYWYARLGAWCLLVHLAASLVLAMAVAYHAFGFHEQRSSLARG